jgi:tRNA G10  N-methylase Trm11
MKQVFILGRNPELSQLEIQSYLEAREEKYKEIFFEDSYLCLELNQEININELGGVIKSVKVLSEGHEGIVSGYIYDNELFESDKFTYGMFGNAEPDAIKQKFKMEKRKAVQKHGRRRMDIQDGEKMELPKADVFFFLHTFGKNIYFGIINQEYDSKDVAKRDMNKPERREHLAISPRLSKILINLSGARNGDLLLDPFCGVGGVLQEALLKKISVYGSDIDADAIKSALKNFKWLKHNYKITNPYILERRDANKILNKQFDAIATETPLGEVVRKRPNDRDAERIIRSFERLIIPILKHLKFVKKRKAKIAITFPRIREHEADFEKIVEETGLELVYEPIIESRPNQYISRDIVVLQ